MEKDQLPYDTRRNLATHEKNFAALTEKPAKNCKLCAAVICELNITPKKILAALEAGNFDAVDTFGGDCEDRRDDPIAMQADLRHLD